MQPDADPLPDPEVELPLVDVLPLPLVEPDCEPELLPDWLVLPDEEVCEDDEADCDVDPLDVNDDDVDPLELWLAEAEPLDD